MDSKYLNFRLFYSKIIRDFTEKATVLSFLSEILKDLMKAFAFFIEHFELPQRSATETLVIVLPVFQKQSPGGVLQENFNEKFL